VACEPVSELGRFGTVETVRDGQRQRAYLRCQSWDSPLRRPEFGVNARDCPRNSGLLAEELEKSRFDRTDWWHVKEANDATITDHIDAKRASPTIYGISHRIIDGPRVCIACIANHGGIEPVFAMAQERARDSI
jgi:hypothetical protein